MYIFFLTYTTIRETARQDRSTRATRLRRARRFHRLLDDEVRFGDFLYVWSRARASSPGAIINTASDRTRRGKNRRRRLRRA